MPRIPTPLPSYVAQQSAATGPIRGGTARPVDFSGIARGADAIGDTLQRNQLKQQHESERLAEEEAKSYVGNEVSRARMEAVESLTNAKTAAPESAAGFTERFVADWDKRTEQTVAKAPERARKALQERLTELKVHLHQDAFQFETKARLGTILKDFESGLDADAKTVFANPAMFSDVAAQRMATARALGLPESDRAALAERTKQTLAFQAASAIIDRDPNAFLTRVGVRGQATGKDGKPGPSDPAKAAAAVAADPMLSSLKADHLRTLVDQATALSVHREAQRQAEIERAAHKAEMAAAKREREATTAYTILSDWARNGVAADPAASAPLLKKIAGTPYGDAYAKLAEGIPKRTAAAMQPLTVQQAQIDALKTERGAKGTSPALEHEITEREQILTAARKDYENDPLRAGAERGLLPSVAPLNMASLDTIVAGLPERVAQADSLRPAVGKHVPPLTPEEAGKVGDMLDALPPTQRSQRIAQITAAAGPGQASAIAAQIDKKNRGLALEFAVATFQTSQGRYTGEIIARARQALKEKTVREDTTVETNLRKQLSEALGDAIGGKAREDVLDAARLISLGKEAEGERISPAGAVGLAIGGSIIEHNGKRIPVDSTMDGGRFKEALRSYPLASIMEQAPSGYVFLPGGRPMGAPEFLSVLPDAELEPAGQGRYKVRAGGSLVMNEKRQPIIVEVRP
jgi:hypothetical protein